MRCVLKNESEVVMSQQSSTENKTKSAPAPMPRRRNPIPPAQINKQSEQLMNDASGRNHNAFSLSMWAILPLRAFMGITFAYAGIQKLTDPGFFAPGSHTYIGTQLQAFARVSPIGGFLTSVAVPHAALFGAMVAWGELAIGLGALVGLLFRPAAFFGFVLSSMLWLSASWDIKPYFLGSDVFAVFAWLTLMLTGTGGILALDYRFGSYIEPFLQNIFGRDEAQQLLVFFDCAPAIEPQIIPSKKNIYSKARVKQNVSRRQFIQGAFAGIIGSLLGMGIWKAMQPVVKTPAVTTSGSNGAVSASAATASTSSSSANFIADTSAVPTNSSFAFTVTSSQDPGILIHLSDNKFVAYDAVCTHAGCTVQYDPNQQVIYCPCHGATFDPVNNAQVLGGPAPAPLTPVSISIDSTGAISQN